MKNILTALVILFAASTASAQFDPSPYNIPSGGDTNGYYFLNSRMPEALWVLVYNYNLIKMEEGKLDSGASGGTPVISGDLDVTGALTAGSIASDTTVSGTTLSGTTVNTVNLNVTGDTTLGNEATDTTDITGVLTTVGDANIGTATDNIDITGDTIYLDAATAVIVQGAKLDLTSGTSGELEVKTIRRSNSDALNISIEDNLDFGGSYGLLNVNTLTGLTSLGTSGSIDAGTFITSGTYVDVGSYLDVATDLTVNGNTTLGDAGTDTITINGNITYADTYWDDLKIPVNDLDPPGPALDAPDWVALSGIGSFYALGFDDSSDESVYFTLQLPHSWKAGTDISPHVHVTQGATADATDVVFGLEYTWAGVNEVFASSTTIYGTNTLNGIAWDHEIHPIYLDMTPPAGASESSMLICRLFRDADVAEDTKVGDIYLLEVDFHFQIEKPGSDNEIP